ncbi:MAG: stage III sporulation protein AE [Syntrophomonas sp.]
MIKKLCITCLMVLLVMLMLPLPAWAANSSEDKPVFSFQDAVKNLDLDALEEYKGSVDGEINTYMNGKTVSELLVDFVKGDWEFDIKELGSNLFKFLFKEIVANSSLLGKLLVLSVLAALLVNLQTAFSSGVAQISYMACFLALAAIALGSFKVVLAIGQQTIDNMVSFMMAMLPQMLVLTAGLGNLHSSAVLFPILMTVSTAFANAIKNIVFPLIILSAILSLLNHMSNGLKVERMSKFFGQMAQISLGLFLSIFVGFVTLRALYASVLDKVALRTTKFITDNAIPVVGKMFSDTIEVAAGYVVMIKQALGILGVLIVFSIIIFPLLKVAALALIYKVTAAIVEPLGDAKTAAILDTMSSHLFLMLAAVASVGLMFFIMIAIVAGMSNGVNALR